MGFSDLFSTETIKAVGRGNLWKNAFKSKGGPRGKTMAESYGITEDNLEDASKNKAMTEAFAQRGRDYIESHPLQQKLTLKAEIADRKQKAKEMQSELSPADQEMQRKIRMRNALRVKEAE